MSGKGGSVMGDADHQSTAIFHNIVNPIRNGDADGIGAEVVIENPSGAAFPTTAWIPEVAYQFTLLGIDTDDGQMTTLETVAQVGEIFELEVAMGAVAGGDLFVIDAQRIAHLAEQARDGIGADRDAEGAEFLGDSGGGAAGPAQAGHGIAGSVVLQQAMEDIDYVGRFFSAAERPPP